MALGGRRFLEFCVVIDVSSDVAEVVAREPIEAPQRRGVGDDVTHGRVSVDRVSRARIFQDQFGFREQAARRQRDAERPAVLPRRGQKLRQIRVIPSPPLECRTVVAREQPHLEQEPRGFEARSARIDGGSQIRFCRMQRRAVPIGCNHLAMFIDVQANLLFFVVSAWEDDFTGYVVDYGSFPEQKRPYFTLRDARNTLALATKASGLEGSIYAGLERLAGARGVVLLLRRWLLGALGRRRLRLLPGAAGRQQER